MLYIRGPQTPRQWESEPAQLAPSNHQRATTPLFPLCGLVRKKRNRDKDKGEKKEKRREESRAGTGSSSS